MGLGKQRIEIPATGTQKALPVNCDHQSLTQVDRSSSLPSLLGPCWFAPWEPPREICQKCRGSEMKRKATPMRGCWGKKQGAYNEAGAGRREMSTCPCPPPESYVGGGAVTEFSRIHYLESPSQSDVLADGAWWEWQDGGWSHIPRMGTGRRLSGPGPACGSTSGRICS